MVRPRKPALPSAQIFDEAPQQPMGSFRKAATAGLSTFQRCGPLRFRRALLPKAVGKMKRQPKPQNLTPGLGLMVTAHCPRPVSVSDQTVHVAASTRSGPTHVNEDVCFIASSADVDKVPMRLFLLLDGHGCRDAPSRNPGLALARRASHALALYFKTHVPHSSFAGGKAQSNGKSFIAQMVSHTASFLNDRLYALTLQGGCTVTIVVHRGGKSSPGGNYSLWVANLGDTRAFVAQRSNSTGECQYVSILTEEQSVSEPAQQKWIESRLRQVGYLPVEPKMQNLNPSPRRVFLNKSDNQRVWLEHHYVYAAVSPCDRPVGIQVTGSLGDRQLNVAKRSLIEASEVRFLELMPSDDFDIVIVIASDGVWRAFDHSLTEEVASQEDSCRLLLERLTKKNPKSSFSLAEGIDSVVSFASGLSRDDTTAVVVHIEGCKV